MSTPRIGVIISTTRPTRFADKPAAWLMEKAKARTDMSFELIDLRDYDLPFFDEMASNLWMPSKGEEALKWQAKLAEFDGFIFVTAEYNHSISGVLKNALDQAYNEWVRKPMAVFGYGGVGAARAAEHLRGIAVELQMVPIRAGVYLGGGEFMKVFSMGENKEMSEVDAVLSPSADAMFDDLAWWANATKTAREAS